MEIQESDGGGGGGALWWWEFSVVFVLRPFLAAFFVLFIILFSWFVAWKTVLVHVPLVQEICGLKKKTVKPKPPTRHRLSRFYNSNSFKLKISLGRLGHLVRRSAHTFVQLDTNFVIFGEGIKVVDLLATSPWRKNLDYFEIAEQGKRKIHESCFQKSQKQDDVSLAGRLPAVKTTRKSFMGKNKCVGL